MNSIKPETYYITDELAEFFGEAKGQKMSVKDLERNMQTYVRRNSLQYGPSILIDSKISKLCNITYGSKLPYSHLNGHSLKSLLSKHLISEKLNASSQQSSSPQITPVSISNPTQSNPNAEQTSKMSPVKKVVTNAIIKESTQSTIPVDNINICIVGGVSTGKSTILNSIFCEKLSECKIKRTTMVPTVYIENESIIDSPEQIFTKIEQKNKEIIEKTEKGIPVTEQEYAELQFNVGKLDINIIPDSYVNVYDIPGLNDARTKAEYYEYLERNFFKFNLIVFIVDIHSGLNTSDEADILRFIADHTRNQLDKNQKKIYTLVVVNKADDMQLKEGGKNGELEIVGELDEMFKQVQNAVISEFKAKNIADHLVGDGVIPLCAIDSYLYRMTKKHGANFKLTDEQILKIGINRYSGFRLNYQKIFQQVTARVFCALSNVVQLKK
jgi:GTP-binding protein EngB required for normal cell division